MAIFSIVLIFSRLSAFSFLPYGFATASPSLRYLYMRRLFIRAIISPCFVDIMPDMRYHRRRQFSPPDRLRQIFFQLMPAPPHC
jgi:hypothetical protein